MKKCDLSEEQGDPSLARRKAGAGAKAGAATSNFESGMVTRKAFGSFRRRLNG